MFNTIMTPVDLAHPKSLSKALGCTADLAKAYDAQVVLVGVTATTPGSVAHTPEEYSDKLRQFAKEQGALHGFSAQTHMMISHDPTADLDDKLLGAISETGADLVVMASHLPNIADVVWPSNGGKIATHADISVLIVRG